MNILLLETKLKWDNLILAFALRTVRKDKAKAVKREAGGIGKGLVLDAQSRAEKLSEDARILANKILAGVA